MTIFSVDNAIQQMRREPVNGEEKLVILGTGQGRGIGDLYARLPTGPNQPPSQYLWARDIGSITPFEIIGGGSVTIGHDVSVWVEWLSSENMWRLKRADLSYLTTIRRSVHFDNPNDVHNQNHRTDQLLPLRSFPAGGMKLAVAGVRFTDKQGRNVDWKGTRDVGTYSLHINLTAYVPATAGHKCYALVYFDVEEYHLGNHPIGIVVSTSQTSALDGSDIQECLDQLNALGTEYLESMAVRLDNSQTVWRGHGDDQDRRPWLTGNGANPQIIITSADESVVIVEDPSGTFDLSVASSSGMTSFGVEGDSGDPFDIEDADILTFQGANGIVVSTDDATKTVIIDGSGVVSLPTSLDLLNQTAGESWSIRDNLYFKMSSASWFKIDNNAIPIAVGTLRGVATAAATGGSADNTIRVKGMMTGYSGLTPGLPLYASGTAGGYTQTKPTLTAGGGQIAICEMGMALSASSAWIEPKPVEYHKRESLANAATLSITHHADAQGRSRTTRAYIASSTTVLLETYATSNRDAAIQLKGQSGAGSTTTPDSVGAAAYQLGDQGGSEYRVAQSFTVTSAGILTSATIFAAANAGSPTGFPTVSVRLDDGTGKPSTTSLDSVTLSSWTPSATNTITFTGGVFLSTGVTYWLVAEAPPQATGVTFAINRNTGNPYANGQFKADANLANTWTAFAGATNDMRCSITVSAIVLNDAVAQGFSHASSTDVLYIDLYLKRTGTRTGDLTLEIQSNSGGLPSGTPITNGVSAAVLASSVDTSWELVRFTFSSPAITSGVQYHAVLKTTDTASNTAYIEVGVDTSSPGYANGAVALLQSSSWGAASPAADTCFDIYGVGTYYDQPVLVGLGSPVLNVWYGDASYADQDTTTTFKNVYGVTIDVVSIVEME